jgi:hypothetical protein
MPEYKITSDAYKMIQAFDREVALAPIRTAAITERNGNKLIGMVRALSPFRTGEYRASHQLSLVSTGQSFTAEVYTDLPRGRMLEFGGDQIFSNGSTIYRNPKPHYRPAFEFVSAQYYDELSRFMTL